MNPFDEARTRATPEARASIDLVEAFFKTLEAMDFEATGRSFAEDGVYCDEPAHAMNATGPEGIRQKLATSIIGLDAFIMGVDTVVGDADRVTTRRTEEWHFSTGEVAKLPVLCLHEIEGGKIKRWHEFWNMPSLIAQMPPSWLEERARQTT
jgi:limonene-1,2-epoxide hydrolase